jgi:hypothetical protein
MRKLFLLAFSPLIIGSLWLMTYYGITSHDTGEKVFAVIAITLFVVWLINPAFLGDTLFEDEDLTQSKKNLNIKKTAILLIFISLGTSFIVFSRTTSNFVENAEKKEKPVSIYVTKTYEENSVNFNYKWKDADKNKNHAKLKLFITSYILDKDGVVLLTKENEVFAKEGRDFTIELKDASPEIVNKLKSGEYSFRYDMTVKQTE